MHFKQACQMHGKQLCNTQVLMLGGGDTEGQLADAWLLDVATLAWTAMPALPSPRSWHSAHMLLTDRVPIADHDCLHQQALLSTTERQWLYNMHSHSCC